MTISNYIAKTNNKITKYLQQELADKISDIPVLLFTSNSTNSKFQSVILFDKFGISEENSLNLQAEITEHYVEDNTVRNDHWAIKPKTYTLTGVLGEVIYQKPSGFSALIDSLASKLTPLTAIMPTLGNYTSAVVNVASQIESSINRYKQIATNIYSSITGVSSLANQNKSYQQLIYDKLSLLMSERQLVDVATPYGTLTQMAVTNIIFRQSADSQFASSIEITLQEWRSVSTYVRKSTKDERDLLSSLQNTTVSKTGEAQQQKNSILVTAFGGKTLNQTGVARYSNYAIKLFSSIFNWGQK